MNTFFQKSEVKPDVSFTTDWIGKDKMMDLDDEQDIKKFANKNKESIYGAPDFNKFAYKKAEVDDEDDNKQKDEKKRKLPSTIFNVKNNNECADKMKDENKGNFKTNLDFTKKSNEKENNKKKSYMEMKQREGFQKENEKLKNESTNIKDFDPDAQISLSQSQFRVLKAILQRKSVFYTGAAGTGKSYILRVFQDVMDFCKATSTFYLTAPTGVAACNIGGQTIHTWAGIGQTLDHNDENFVNQIGRSVEAKSRWKTAELLVIDEISMLSAEIFEALNTGGKRVRANNNPFGGIQVVVCGDFFQLPPIGVNSRDPSKKVNYCFNSAVWNTLFGHSDGMIVLDKVFRQKEQSFLDMLNELRRGVTSERTHKLLIDKCNLTYNEERKMNQLPDGDENESQITIVPTKLFPTNKDVEITNERELAKLPGDIEVYKALSEGKAEFKKQLLQGMKAPPILELKVSTQVMLLKNLDVANGLVNGTRGVVIGFTPKGEDSPTSYGAGSVLFKNCSLPIVNFVVKVGNSSYEREITLKEETWELKSGERTMATYQQIPLMQAWAISIHKSQGMTITNLEVSFNGMFEFGQAYVALSRATDFDKLKLKGYQRGSVKCSKEVLDFYKQLGYNKESFHKDESTVHTSIKELSHIFLSTEKPSSPEPENDGWMDSKEKKVSVKNINFGISKHQESLLGQGVLPISSNQRDIIEKTKLEVRTVVELSDEDDEPEANIIKIDSAFKTPFSDISSSATSISNIKADVTPIVYGNPLTSPFSNPSKLTEEQRKKCEQNRLEALEKKRKREEEQKK